MTHESVCQDVNDQAIKPGVSEVTDFCLGNIKSVLVTCS